MIELTKGIRNNLQLKLIELIIGRRNRIGEEGGANLGSALGDLINLNKLFLNIGSDNDLGSSTGIRIGKSLKNL